MMMMLMMPWMSTTKMTSPIIITIDFGAWSQRGQDSGSINSYVMQKTQSPLKNNLSQLRINWRNLQY